jgi:hypothetical protein
VGLASRGLSAVETDRSALLEQRTKDLERAKQAERSAERLRKDLADERARGDRLEEELVAKGFDPEQRFLRQIRLKWQRLTRADRDRYPLQDPILGPEFLDSVEKLQGVSRERVVEVCAHVACGRAPDVPSLDLHPLRSSEGGGTPQRERADGAKAWRCNLQTGTASARRLHFWQLPGGRVELAKVVVHDDFSIR